MLPLVYDEEEEYHQRVLEEVDDLKKRLLTGTFTLESQSFMMLPLVDTT
jgi:hypothetical protein